ncbi:MAG TPA: type III PLP-dependent enzyme, partial [Candidatus Eisenbacteria bacterium]|nr:type III PLP-dependent enzyme [Candidatus Eisenbacteria bacterium]
MAERPAALKKPQAQPDPDPSPLFDTHPEVRLDFKHVRKALKQGYTKPFLLVDTGIVRTKARRFKAAMPRVHPHYAVKANPDPRVLKVLIEE